MSDDTGTTEARQGRPPGLDEGPAEGVHAEAPGNESQAEGELDAEPDYYGRSRTRRLRDCPRKYRQLYERAWAGKSRKAAIRAQCLECVGWLPREVELCTAPACPLYEYRLKG